MLKSSIMHCSGVVQLCLLPTRRDATCRVQVLPSHTFMDVCAAALARVPDVPAGHCLQVGVRVCVPGSACAAVVLVRLVAGVLIVRWNAGK